MTALRGAAQTDVGRVRSVNQDGALTSPFLVAVADGMGGHRAGEVASALALRSLAAHERFPSASEVVQAVRQANDSIFAAAAEEPDLRGMGTTLCALALVDPGGSREGLALVNVGDSRAYHVRSGELIQLTVDHSLVQLMVQEGQLRPEDAESHPQRNILTRALGIESDVVVDSWQLSAEPGDRFLLCSDGLFNEVDPGRIAATLRAYADPGEAARVLVGLANAAGGRDNVTCVVVDVVDAVPETPGETTRSDGAEATNSDAKEAGTAGVGSAGADDRSRSAGRDAGRSTGRAEGRRRSGRTARAATGSPVVTAEHPVVGPTGEIGPRGSARLGARPSGAANGASRPADRAGADAGSTDSTTTATLPPHQRFDDEPAEERPPPRRLTLRVLAFLVGTLAVLAVAGLAIGWYATRTYFVGFEGEQVSIFRGRPGGLLWIEPTVAEPSEPPLVRAGLVEALCDRVAGQPSATDLGDARRIVEQLRADQRALPPPSRPCGAAG